MKHLTQEDLALLYFDEHHTGPRAHLAECAACRAEFEDVRHFLDRLKSVPVPECDPAFESRLWAGLAPQIQRELSKTRKSWFRPWLLAPALAALLAVAFIAGMYTQHHADGGARSFSAKARDRVLLIALGDHLDRSQIVLAEIMNAPEGKPVDFASEQQMADSLVSQNRLLRQTAARRGDASDAAVLDQLERLLTDIAHSPREVSPAQLDELRERIEAQGLLFKVRIVSSNVREKGMKL